jgi:hypothetical protein
MDVLPASTHAAEIAATVDDLQQGLDRLPLAKAVNRIDDWRRQILESERADLRPIADDLGALHGELTGTHLDGRTIGRLLVRLGEGTAAAADSADEPMQNGLRRLGSLLGHAGRALAGTADDAPRQAAGSDPGPDTAGDVRPTAPPGE